MKSLGRFMRRKSISERELRKDYPTNSDSDDNIDEEYRRAYWQRGLNAKASDRQDDFSDNLDVGHWDYESEYNYSIHSESDANDGYNERSPRLYSDMGVERAIEQAMKNEFMNRDELKPHRMASDERKDNYRTHSSVNETVRQFEQNLAKRRSSAIHQTPPFEQTGQKNNRENYNKTFHAFSRKKQRKQNKHRRRARDINSDLSDDDDTKYAVNITMDDLNNLIKKNINSAVKSIVSKTKSNRPISPCESISTETETFFSGSSSQSAEIAPGLLAKQIKAQLDIDKLRGIIKQAVANETSDVFRKTNSAIYNTNTVQASGTPVSTPRSDFQQSAHLNPYVTHAQMIPSSHPQVPPPPPPPPPPVPMVSNLMPPQLTFTMSDGMAMRPPAPQQFLDDMTLTPGALRRLNTRRHTLAALGSDPDISALGDGLDNKMEQFSNALKLIDKTIQKAEDSVSQSKAKDEENKNNANVKPDVDVKPATQNAEVSNFGSVATIPGGGLAPILSIADHIKALSQKKKREPKPGELEMSSCARTFLILSNLIFLMAGGAVISLGVWLLMDPNIETYFQIINVDQSGTDFKVVCYGLTAFGVFALGIALLGCCGAVQRSKCLVTLFLVMVGVLTMIEVGIGGMIILNRNSPSSVPILSSILADMESYLRKQLKISLINSYIPDTLIGTTWDLVQKHLECCGATGVEDYLYSKWKNDTNPETDFPDTCCVLIDKNAEVPEPSNKLLCHFNTEGFYFETGCYDKMVGWFKDNSTYIVIASSVILAIEVFSFVSAFIICRKAAKLAKRKKEAKRNSLAENKQGINVRS